MSKNDGGAAFPMHFTAVAQSCGDKETVLNVPLPEDVPQGMSLRDWFAGRAMQGKLAAEAGVPLKEWCSWDQLSSMSYQIADAMLEARSK